MALSILIAHPHKADVQNKLWIEFFLQNIFHADFDIGPTPI